MFTIRPLTRYEYVWIRSKDFAHLYSHLSETEPMPEKEYEEWYKFITNNPLATLFGVIENDTKLIGIGSLWLQPKYYHNQMNAGFIEDIIIDRPYRKKGLGKQLVKYIVDYGKNEKKCYKINLYCDSDLDKFYGANGFKKMKSGMEIRF